MSEKLERVAELLTELGAVSIDDDEGLIIIEIGSTRASVQVLELFEGLTVATIGQLVGVDLPNDASLAGRLEKHAAGLSFGSVLRSAPDEDITDVVLRYTFPIGGLDDMPLLMMFNLVLGAGAELAEAVA